MKRHFSAKLAERPRICSYHNPIPKNLGTFVRIPQKVVGYFLAVRTVVGGNILEVFLAVRTVVRENMLEVFLAVRMVVGGNILEVL